MGGKSSSSSSTTNNQWVTSGQSHVDGDNHGLVLSGVNGSNITVTDQGAVKAALEAMKDTAGEALEANVAVSNNAINLAGDVVDSSKDLVNSALNASQGATEAALDVAKNITLSNDHGTAQEMTKYFALTFAAIGVAVALRGGLK